MLRRVTLHDDPELLRLLPIQQTIEQKALTGFCMPNVSFGRQSNNEFVLTSVGIPLLLSRQHALITYDGEQLTLVDLDTTNGTFVSNWRRGAARCAALVCCATSRHAIAVASTAPGCFLQCNSDGALQRPHVIYRFRCRSQVNTCILPRNARRVLRVGDVICFGGASTVRLAFARARASGVLGRFWSFCASVCASVTTEQL